MELYKNTYLKIKAQHFNLSVAGSRIIKHPAVKTAAGITNIKLFIHKLINKTIFSNTDHIYFSSFK